MKRIIAGVLGAMLLGTAAGAAEQPAEPYQPQPYRITEQAEIVEVHTSVHEGDITLVPRITVKTDTWDELTLMLGEDTFLADARDGTVKRMTDVSGQTDALQTGDTLLVSYEPEMTRSIPPQTHAELVVTHPDEGVTPHLLDVEVLYRDETVRFLTDNAGLVVSVDAQTPVQTLYGEAAEAADLHMGATVVAWYDIVALSMPGQTAAQKVVLLPQQDRTFTILTGGDIAIAQGRVENGVAMVPVRAVAEALGYTVSWDGVDESVRLSLDGSAAADIRLGADRYSLGDGGSGLALGAASYEVDGVSWVPAEVFTRLGHSGQALTGSVMHLSGRME